MGLTPDPQITLPAEAPKEEDDTYPDSISTATYAFWPNITSQPKKQCIKKPISITDFTLREHAKNLTPEQLKQAAERLHIPTTDSSKQIVCTAALEPQKHAHIIGYNFETKATGSTS